MTNRSVLVQVKVVALTILILLPARWASGRLVPSFDVVRLMREARVVCKVRVISVKSMGNIKPSTKWIGIKTEEHIATCRVLSKIKGSLGKSIDIRFRKGVRERDARDFGFTDLSVGEVCIVFLKGDSSLYKFVGDYKCKMLITPDAIKHDLGKKPHDRLLAELIATVGSTKGVIRLRAVRELGKLGDARAEKSLRALSASEDVVLIGEFVRAMFRIRKPPKVESVLMVLEKDPKKFGSKLSRKKYGTSNYAISLVQHRLVETIDHVSREVHKDPKTGRTVYGPNRLPMRGLTGFDYPTFFRRAMQCKSVRENTQIRYHVGCSVWVIQEKKVVPDCIKLLDDPDVNIRYWGFAILQNTVNAGPATTMQAQVTPEMFKKDERRYVIRWKNWWDKNRKKFGQNRK